MSKFQVVYETNIYSFGVLTTQTTYNLKAIITDLSNQEIDEMMKEWDIDLDGQLNYEEFKRMMIFK